MQLQFQFNDDNTPTTMDIFDLWTTIEFHDGPKHHKVNILLATQKTYICHNYYLRL